jgi:hypothetical protein
MAYCKAMLERNKTVPAVPSWALFDAQYMRKYILAGTMPGTKKPQRWYEEGYLKTADTIEGLAASLKIDPATLKATVERFNGFVAQNRDDDFHRGERAYDRWLGDHLHKPSETLGSIAEPPFYAVPVLPGDVGTYGGVVTDEHARVLRDDGSAIEGLYATGVSTASVMGPAIRAPGRASVHRSSGVMSPQNMPRATPRSIDPSTSSGPLPEGVYWNSQGANTGFIGDSSHESTSGEHQARHRQHRSLRPRGAPRR